MSGPYGRQELPDLPLAYLQQHLAQPEARSGAEEDEDVKPTEGRLRMFILMLSRPEEEWTTAQLMEALGGEPVSASAVRDTFYLLMHDQTAEPVPFQRALTVRLTPAGRQALRTVVSRWSAGNAPEGEVAK